MKIQPGELAIKIKPVINSFGRYTDLFIIYKGEFYYTRYPYALNDNPATRNSEAVAFERRLNGYQKS